MSHHDQVELYEGEFDEVRCFGFVAPISHQLLIPLPDAGRLHEF